MPAMDPYAVEEGWDGYTTAVLVHKTTTRAKKLKFRYLSDFRSKSFTFNAYDITIVFINIISLGLHCIAQ